MSTIIFGFHAIAEILKRSAVKGSLYLLPEKKKNDGWMDFTLIYLKNGTIRIASSAGNYRELFYFIG